MNAIDIRTLAIVLSLANFMQVIALYVQYRIDKNHRGLGFWTLGNASLALGFAFNYMRNIPEFAELAIILNNALFVSGFALIYTGVLRFTEQHERPVLLAIFCALSLMVAVYFTYMDNDLGARRMNISVAISILSCLIAWSLFKNQDRSIEASAKFLMLVFLFNALFFLARTLTVVGGLQLGDAFAPTLTQTATYLVALVITTLSTFGFIILVNQKLNAESLEAKENLELIFETCPDAVLITRLKDGFFSNINQAFSMMTGYARADVIGKTTLDVNLWHDPADRQRLLSMLGEKGFCANLEAVFLRKDGSRFIGMMSAKRILLQGSPHIISVTRDISENKRLENELKHLATTDELTGIANRRHFLALALEEMKRAYRFKHSLSLVLIDVDYFKHINDNHGHAAGDKVLWTFASVCQNNIREIDLFARFGGDEFVLLLPETNGEQACVTVERIRQALIEQKIELAGQSVSITISSGITSLAGDQEYFDALLSRADQALYLSKQAGRDRVTVKYSLG